MASPLTGFFDLFTAAEDRSAQKQTQAANAARLAFSAHTIESTGVGTFRRAAPILFDVVFTSEPKIMTGLALLAPAPDGYLDPDGMSGVWQWHRNLKGHYLGAYVYMSVRMTDTDGFSSPSAAASAIQVQHHLTFMGMGYKDLGNAVANDAQVLTPRTVGFGGM